MAFETNLMVKRFEEVVHVVLVYGIRLILRWNIRGKSLKRIKSTV